MTPPPLSMFDLLGKVALVTGGVGHLGRAISSGLAQAGARVVLASRAAAADLSAREGPEPSGGFFPLAPDTDS